MTALLLTYKESMSTIQNTAKFAKNPTQEIDKEHFLDCEKVYINLKASNNISQLYWDARKRNPGVQAGLQQQHTLYNSSKYEVGGGGGYSGAILGTG